MKTLAESFNIIQVTLWVKNKSMSLQIITLIVLSVFFSQLLLANDALDTSRKIVNQTNQKLEKNQVKINDLHAQTEQSIDKYKGVLNESESYQVYNQQLTDIIGSQTTEFSSLQNQIVEIEVTAQKIMPMMQRMILALEAFIEQDLPFLPQERANRLSKLNDTMKRANISVAEKYRKILEAYQIEIEYGKTLETYEGELANRKVNFLKVGRVALFYRSPDASHYAVWNGSEHSWVLVDNHEVRKSIDLGLKIARKQHSPELLIILANKADDAQ